MREGDDMGDLMHDVCGECVLEICNFIFLRMMTC